MCATAVDDEIVVVAPPSERRDRNATGAASSGLGLAQRMLCQVVKAGPTPRHVGFISYQRWYQSS